MPERRLIKVGDRIINLDAITHASYDPTATNPAAIGTWSELAISFGCDDCTILYGLQAEQMWSLLTAAIYCEDITPDTVGHVLEELVG